MISALKTHIPEDGTQRPLIRLLTSKNRHGREGGREGRGKEERKKEKGKEKRKEEKKMKRE